MKKLLTAAIIGAAGIGSAHAAMNCCADAPCCQSVSSSCSYDSSCTSTLTCNCGTSSTGLANKYGIVATTTQKQESYYVGQTAYSRCVAGTTTYKCASGYYGTATSASAGCTACPDNATCAGGNGSTFICNRGYYKSGAACQPCPNSGGINGRRNVHNVMLSAVGDDIQRFHRQWNLFRQMLLFKLKNAHTGVF